MNLIERYALSCGLKIGKPYIYPKFFPLTVDKYITAHFQTKDAKSYDLAQEVIDIISPALSALNISIIQIGQQGDIALRGCYFTNGQTSINQVAYLIQNTLLHVGVDSMPVHLAGSFDKPIVALYSTNYKECVKPYWGDKNKQRLLEPVRENLKPSFSYTENPKTINTIKPEFIAKQVLELLNIPFEYKFETVFFGRAYQNKIIETVPNQVIDNRQFNIDGAIVRMDYLFNQENLVKQLQICPCSIVTKDQLDQNLLIQFKDRIREVVYFIDQNSDPKFVELLNRIGVKHVLISDLDEGEITKLKINYMAFSPIVSCKTSKPDNLDTSNLWFKSSKIILSDGKLYPSFWAYKNNKNIESFIYDPIQAVDDPDFWKDLDNLYLLRKVS